MKTLTSLALGVLLLVTVASTTGCAKKAPATPQILTAALDSVRDVAKDANATTPPLISSAVLLQIVSVHDTLVQTIGADGWRAKADVALAALKTDLSPAAAAKIAPYIDAATLLVDTVK